MAIKWFDSFFGASKHSYTIEELKNSKYGEYFEHLQQNLDRLSLEREMYQSIVDILQISVEDSDIQVYLSAVLKAIPDFGFNTVRLVLFKDSEWGMNRINAGLGEGNRELAYLDEQFVHLLKDTPRIFIADTAKIHTLKFNPQHKAPRTILGLALQDLKMYRGILWFSSENPNDITKDAADRINMILNAMAKSLDNYLLYRNILEDSLLYKKIFKDISLPAIVIIGGKAYSRNFEFEKLLGLEKLIDENLLINDLLSAFKNKTKVLSAGNYSFNLYWADLGNFWGREGYVFFLMDESLAASQRSYLATILAALTGRLRKPLKNISDYLEMTTLLSELNDPQKDYLEKIKNQVSILSALIEDLLEVNRINDTTPLLVSEKSSYDIVESVTSALQPVLRQRKIHLKESSDQKQSNRIFVDEVLFSQAVYLLLDFMMDALKPGATINYSFEEKEDGCSLIFSDDGPGISEIDLTLFDQTQINENIDQRLRIANGIMQFHGGEFNIHSKQGKGSNFVFSFPAGQE